MQSAAVPGYRLARARHSTKVLTSLGLLGLFLGLCSAVLLTVARTGVTVRSVTSYYRGAESVAASDPASLDALTETRSHARPFGELAEVTHLHLMGGSLLLFLLCHLLSVCEISDRARTVLYVISFASFLLTFSIPWAIVYISAAFAWAFLISILTFSLSLLILTMIPLHEMWVRDI